MTPFDLLRRYFTATGIGQVPSRIGAVDELVRGVPVGSDRYGGGNKRNVPFPGLHDAKHWLSEEWQEMDDAHLRRW